MLLRCETVRRTSQVVGPCLQGLLDTASKMRLVLQGFMTVNWMLHDTWRPSEVLLSGKFTSSGFVT